MRIQHNIMAMNAYRNYNNNTSALSKNLERLSSGYKINRAGDDAAGLAISEKMRAQITGLEAAQKNVKDGISLVNTAEGAMQEIQDMLNRMVYLAQQSANGTYDNDVDRKNLQDEVNQLRDEIDRIADSANFNGTKLLDGSLETKTTISAIGDGKAAITKDYLVAESQDGKEPTAASKAKYTVILAGLDTTKAADITAATVGGATPTAAAADTAAKFETDSLTSTAAGDITVTVSYTDAEGNAATKDVSVTTTSTTAATAANDIATAIGNDDTLKELFTASVTNTDKITLEAKTAGSGKGAVTGISITDGTTGTASLGGSPTETKAVDAGSYDLSGWTNDDTITVNGKEYKQADYNSVDDLKAALTADGLEVTGNADGTNTVIKGEKLTSKIAGTAVSNIQSLGATTIDGKKISDHFNVKIGGSEVDDWTSTDEIAPGATIVFEAKIPGKQSGAVAIAFKPGDDGLANATGTVDQEGINEDSGAAATKTKYDLSFNFDNLAGNQRVKIGDKVYELSTSGAKADETSSNVLIDLRGMDPKTDEGKLKIANAIHTAISTGLGADFTATPPTAADVTGTSYALSFEAVAAGASSNKGNIQVFDNPAAITGTYTAGKDQAKNDAARPTKVVYEINLEKLAVGDSITLGTGNSAKTVEIVADDKADPANGKLKLGDAKNADKLKEAFYAQNYDQVIDITGTAGTDQRLTISAAQQTAGGGTPSDTTKSTAAQFSQAAGKVAFSSSTATSESTTEGNPLVLQIGDSSDEYNQLEVSIGDMHVAAMFGLARNTDGSLVHEVGADGKETTVRTSDTIATIDISTQTGAQAAVNVIKDAINYVSSVRGTLGAISNRLDHTANNLSVMRENIQDAESTIRDTDIAEEMMAYTKNNILVQSAQAMLAQANQVPQGVLQLLQ